MSRGAAVPQAGLEESGGRVGATAVETAAFRLLALPVGLATTVITSRYLLPSGRGAYVWAILTATIATTLVGNIGTAYAHSLHEARIDSAALTRLAAWLALGTGLLAAVVLAPVDVAFSSRGYAITGLIAIGVPFLVLAQALNGALLALGQVRAWNVLQATPPVVGLVVLLVLLVGLGRGLTAALLAWCGAQAFGSVAAVFATRQQLGSLRLESTQLREARPLLALSLRIGGTNLASLLNYRIEVIVLEADRGLHAVGIYSLSASLAELTWIVSAALAASIVSNVVTASEENAAAMVARAARHAILASAVLGLSIAATSELFVPLLFGSAFRGSVRPLLILLPGSVLFAPAGILAVWFSMRMGRTRYPFAISIASGAITLAAALVLIPGLGASGAALATTVGYGASMVLAYSFFARSGRIGVRGCFPGRADVADYRRILGSLRRVVAPMRRGGRMADMGPGGR